MNNTKLSRREIAYIATFGAAWGISEITLGFILHSFYIPFSGLILTLIGIVIALCALKFTSRKRTIIYVALIAAILKMLSFTTVKFGPIVGILGSATLAQLVILILGINPISFIVAGGVMGSWSFLQNLLFQTVVYTPEIFKIYQDLLDKIGLKSVSIGQIIIIVIILHFSLGCITGLYSWFISQKLIKKARFNSNAHET